MYLFGHDTRNLTPSVARSGKAMTIKTAGLLLRELEAEIILADRWAHGTVCATPSPGTTTPKHEPGSQLGTTRRSQNLALILLSKSSKSWGSEALREGAAVVGLLLAETGITVNLAFFEWDGSIFSILHHDTQVRSVGSDRAVVVRSTN